VLENKTGRILAMAGGFSYPLSQLNRATQSVRQPGSAIKPLSYLAALGKGLQPNTLVEDDEITLPPLSGGKEYWTPKNYDGSSRQHLDAAYRDPASSLACRTLSMHSASFPCLSRALACSRALSA
jgi:penicillin-binding protein 1A